MVREMDLFGWITSDVMEMKVLYNSAPTWELEKTIAIMMKMLVLSVSEIQVYNNHARKNWTHTL